MQSATLKRIYKITGVIIVFHSIWIILVVGLFILMVTVEKGRIFILASMPVLAIASILFTIYINRKIKQINSQQDSADEELRKGRLL